jgi:polysaccharide export outer membrane protein
MIQKIAFGSVWLLLSLGSLSAQQVADRSPEYRLHPSDVLEVKFRYTPEFDQTVTVRPDDRISLNGAGTLIAAGLTLEEFRSRVVQMASARLVDPEVTVELKEFERPHVMVEGEVAAPGKVELRGNLSALDAIALAGGFKNTGKQSKVLLLRQQDDGTGTTRVLDLKQLVAKERLEEGTQLRPGDVIYVTQNSLSKVERLVHMGQFGAYYNPVH